MLLKTKLFFAFIVLSLSTLAQTKNNEWQLGISGSVVKFPEADASYIGDQYMFQIPRLNVSAPLTDKLVLDGALSFNTFDVGFISNSAKYFSMDGSLRYVFRGVTQDFLPYAFVGGSLVDSERKMTPTMNIGAGANYWVTNAIGINTQVYYKHSLESYESMRSHIQVTLGIVFALKVKGFGGNSRKKGSVGGACYFNQF